MRRFPFLAFLLLAAAARAELLDGVHVIVNESIITYDEVQRQLEPMARTVAMTYPDDMRAFNDAMASNRVGIVREQVNARLILDEFKTKMNGGDIPESILDDEVRAELRKTYNGNRALMTKTLRERGITSVFIEEWRKASAIIDYRGTRANNKGYDCTQRINRDLDDRRRRI